VPEKRTGRSTNHAPSCHVTSKTPRRTSLRTQAPSTGAQDDDALAETTSAAPGVPSLPSTQSLHVARRLEVQHAIRSPGVTDVVRPITRPTNLTVCHPAPRAEATRCTESARRFQWMLADNRSGMDKPVCRHLQACRHLGRVMLTGANSSRVGRVTFRLRVKPRRTRRSLGGGWSEPSRGEIRQALRRQGLALLEPAVRRASSRCACECRRSA
jgi:hypothetical protein